MEGSVIDRERLAGLMETAETDLRTDKGVLTWERVEAWTRDGKMPATGERGGGVGDAEAEDAARDRMEDAAAARYQDELDKLTKRLEADLLRLCRIMDICCPQPSKQLANRDLLAAQVAAEGWCVSCWRDDQHLTPITLRPGGQPYYRDRCRACGEWKAEHGQDPPKMILELRHAGRRITTADAAKALGRAS